MFELRTERQLQNLVLTKPGSTADLDIRTASESEYLCGFPGSFLDFSCQHILTEPEEILKNEEFNMIWIFKSSAMMRNQDFRDLGEFFLR